MNTERSSHPVRTPPSHQEKHMHLVLLGDSVFDNQAYVQPGGAVIDHLRSTKSQLNRSTLLAVDGDMAHHLPDQLRKLPTDATHLAISVGGNDALECLPTLERPIGGVMEALHFLSQIQSAFAKQHSAAMEAARQTGLPTVVCTIYDSVPGLTAPLKTALSLFNDVIVRNAMARGFDVMDLRELLKGPTDFSAKSPIEPSEAGGAKIAGSLTLWLAGQGC